MKFLSKAVFPLCIATSFLITSCGGGGGSSSPGNNSGFNPPGVTVTTTLASTSTTPFSLVGMTVRVAGANGTAATDGTTVRMQVSPPGIGLVSAGDGQAVSLGETVTATTVGGIANFRFHSRALGTATLVASVTDASAPARSITGTSTIQVVAGPPTDPRIALQIQSTTVPAIPPRLGVGLNTVYPGSPYVSEVTLVQRRLDGSLVNGGGTGGGSNSFCSSGTGAAAAIGSGLNSAALWLPAEGIEDVNGVRTVRLCRSLSLGVNSGRSVFYVVADGPQGTAQLTVTATDPQTGETLQASQEFRISNGSPQLPGSVVIDAGNEPVYITSVNGPRSKQIEVGVYDGGGDLVPAPAQAGVNNVRLEIQGGGQGGERLRGVNGAGTTVQGDAISLRTANGLANATFDAGTHTGPVTLRATSDRADNNVDNGIQDAVTSTRQFTVSDGQLFDLQIATAALADPVSAQVTGPAAGNTNPNAIYRMLITAIGVDRFGNPIPPGSEIRFGLIDEPQANNAFLIAGGDGDPQENGTTFTAPSGAFTTAGGGVGPNDTLVVFAEEGVPGNRDGNRDMEAARTVTAVVSPTQLTVAMPFNPNDVTGTSVNAGPVYPYVVGRAADGNIVATGTTDASGIVRTTLTYAARRLGKRIIVWAQGQGTPVNGRPRLVTDVESFSFAGAGPATITVQPSAIPANRTASVRVCLRDFSGNGIPNAALTFNFSLSAGTGTVDGRANPGLTNPTGADGCTMAQVNTSGVVGSSGNKLTFSSSGASADVAINAGSGALLTVSPNPLVVGPSAGGSVVTLCVLDATGPVPGVQILDGGCTGGSPGYARIAGGIPLTVADGCTTAVVAHDALSAVVGGTVEIRESICTFRTATGLSTTLTVRGSNSCSAFSPPPPGCAP